MANFNFASNTGSGGGTGGDVNVTNEVEIKNDTGSPIPISDSGTPITGTAIPAGGVGLIGWLSAIWKKLIDGVPVTGTFWQVTQPVSGTFWQATQPVSATALPLPTGAATETTQALLARDGAEITGTTMPTGGSGVRGWLSAIWQLMTNGHAVWLVPQANQGYPNKTKVFNLATSTTPTLIKGSAGVLGYLYISNSSGSDRNVKIYDKATAPTVGTDTPAFTYRCPAGQSQIALPAAGIKFTSGIGLAITGNVADNDTATITAANEVIINIAYA